MLNRSPFFLPELISRLIRVEIQVILSTPALFSFIQAELLRKRICRDIDEFKNSVKLAVNNGQLYDTIEEDRVGSLIHVSLVFETEQRCFLKDWQGVLGSIEV